MQYDNPADNSVIRLGRGSMYCCSTFIVFTLRIIKSTGEVRDKKQCRQYSYESGINVQLLISHVSVKFNHFAPVIDCNMKDVHDEACHLALSSLRKSNQVWQFCLKYPLQFIEPALLLMFYIYYPSVTSIDLA